MKSESGRELLCITGRDKHYALDLKWVTEICADVQISSFPCLPPQYLGMFNYKGNIIPVIGLAEDEDRLLVIIRCEDYLFAMAVDREPIIIEENEIEEIDSLHPEALSGIWMEKGLYQRDGTLLSLLDIPGTVEKILADSEKEI